VNRCFQSVLTIDRAGPSNCLALGITEDAVLPTGLRNGRVVPVNSRANGGAHQIRVRDVRIAALVGARLDDGHGRVGILRQAAGQRQATGPAPHDHVVECLGVDDCRAYQGPY
jgi:hypothetical protein